MEGSEKRLVMAENQETIKELLQKILQENQKHNSEIRQNYDDMRHDIAEIKAQLRIIHHNTNMPESPVSVNLQRFIPSQKDSVVRFENLLNGNETLHKDCIQEHLELIIEDLDLECGSLIDHLIEDSCLSGEEAATLKRVDRRNQNRKLSLMISHRSKENFHRFLKHLEKDHNHIHQNLSKSYDSKLRAGKRPSECVICAIKKNVDLAHVVDKLYSKKVVNMEFYEVFCSSSNILTDQSNLWEIIFASIDQGRDRRDKIKLLQEALSQKYEHISTKLNSLWAPRMKCQCFKVKPTEQESDESVGSTTAYRSTLSSPRLGDSVHLSSSLDTNQSSNITNIPSTVAWVAEVDETCTVTTNSSDQDFSHFDNEHTHDDSYMYLETLDEMGDGTYEHHDDDTKKKGTFPLDTDPRSPNTKPSGTSGVHGHGVSKRSKRRTRRKKNKGNKINENESGDSTNQNAIDGTTLLYDLNRNQIGNLIPPKADFDKTDLLLAAFQNVPTLACDACPVSATPETSDTPKSFPQTGSKHPEYVTEQAIITPSKSVDPSSCDIKKQTDYISPTNPKIKGKKRRK